MFFDSAISWCELKLEPRNYVLAVWRGVGAEFRRMIATFSVSGYYGWVVACMSIRGLAVMPWAAKSNSLGRRRKPVWGDLVRRVDVRHFGHAVRH